jgi:hypothetical protein
MNINEWVPLFQMRLFIIVAVHIGSKDINVFNPGKEIFVRPGFITGDIPRSICIPDPDKII